MFESVLKFLLHFVLLNDEVDSWFLYFVFMKKSTVLYSDGRKHGSNTHLELNINIVLFQLRINGMRWDHIAVPQPEYTNWDAYGIDWIVPAPFERTKYLHQSWSNQKI